MRLVVLCATLFALASPGTACAEKSRRSNSADRPVVTVKSLPGQKVEEGTRVRFRIEANRTGFVHVFVSSASGRLQLWMQNVPVDAGQALTYPTDPAYEIVATPPYGRDRIVVLLTRSRLSSLTDSKATSVPVDLQMNRKTFERRIEADLATRPREEWAWGGQTIEVVD